MDRLKPLRERHTCPQCSGTHQADVDSPNGMSRAASAPTAGAAVGSVPSAPAASPWAQLRSLLVER